MIGNIKIQAITLILVLMTSSVQAFGPGFRDHSSSSRGSGKSLEDKSFHLTPEQEAQLKGLRDKFLEETIFFRSEIPIKLAELRTLWTDPKPDKDKINTKKKEIMELYTELQIKATDNRVLAQSFLSQEQAEKLPVFGLHLEIEPNFGLGQRLP
jgi:Spy/CpxP family protein refolding chaperone